LPTRLALARLASARLDWVHLKHSLPAHLPASAVPEGVLGFSVEYRMMIRWKAGLMWRMTQLRQYE
jgi:hypothetical protein